MCWLAELPRLEYMNSHLIILYFKDVSRRIQGGFKSVPMMFQERLKGVSRECLGCFDGISKKFKGYFSVF